MAAVASFRTAVRLTGRGVLLWSLLGRLPNAMCPIGSLLLVSHNSGSVWRGSAVAGALAVSQAVAGPPVGRLADRRGQRRVGLVAAAVNALAILALVIASEQGLPLPWQLAPAALIGLSVPLIGPLSRSRWIQLARGDRESGAAAISLDGIMDEISFTAGPAVVGALATLVDPAAGMVLGAALAGVCGTLFALHPTAPTAPTAPDTPTAPDGARDRRPRPSARLSSTPFALLLAGMALLGVCFGSVQVGVTATTAELGRPGAAGLLYGLIGLTSSFAGVATAALPGRYGLPLRLKAGAVLLLAASVPLPWTGTLTGLALGVGFLGVAVAPQMITMFGLTERTAPAERLGEAMAALVSSITLAQSGGTVLAGWLADRHGPAAPFLLTGAAAAAAALLALATATETRYHRRDHPPTRHPATATAP